MIKLKLYTKNIFKLIYSLQDFNFKIIKKLKQK